MLFIVYYDPQDSIWHL